MNTQFKTGGIRTLHLTDENGIKLLWSRPHAMGGILKQLYRQYGDRPVVGRVFKVVPVLLTCASLQVFSQTLLHNLSGPQGGTVIYRTVDGANTSPAVRRAL